MSQKWNYAQLSENAKLAGGPEKYLTAIKDFYLKKGIKEGKEQMIPVVVIGTLIGIGIGTGGTKVYQYIKTRKKINMIIEKKVKESENQMMKEFANLSQKENIENLDNQMRFKCDNDLKVDSIELKKKDEEM